MKTRRYALTVDLFINIDQSESVEKDDALAIKNAEKIVKKLRKFQDNDATVVTLVEIPFGSIKPRTIQG